CRVDSASPQRSGGLSFRVVGSSTPGVSVELDGWNLGSGEFRLYLPETSDKFVPSGIVAEGYDLRPATAPLTQLRPQSVSLKFQATGHLIVELTGGDLRGIRPMLELKD